MKRFLLVALSSLLIIPACSGENKEPQEELINEELPTETSEINEEAPEPEPIVLTDNRIVFENLEVNKQIGAMTLENIEVYDFDAGSTPGPYNSTLSFSGEVTLSGEILRFSEDGPFFPGVVCLSEIEDPEKAFPVVEGDPRSDRVCFDGADAESFGLEPEARGYATVTIDSYQWIGREGEVLNMATIKSLGEVTTD